MCGDPCASTDNAFDINQGPNIGWFTSTLTNALGIGKIAAPSAPKNLTAAAVSVPATTMMM
jgi:hypothetical protein